MVQVMFCFFDLFNFKYMQQLHMKTGANQEYNDVIGLCSSWDSKQHKKRPGKSSLYQLQY